MTDPTDPFGEKKKKPKRRGGQGNRGRQPGQTGAPKGNRVKPPTPTPTPTKNAKRPSSKASKADIASAGASLAKTIADASPTKHRGPVDAGTPVQTNDKPPEGMDLSVGDYNTSAMNDDDMEYQKKKKMYGL